MRISFTVLALLMLVSASASAAFAQNGPAGASVGMRPGILWFFDLGVGQGYDDNPFGNGQGGYFAQFNPDLSLRQDTQHGSWSIDFQPSLQRFYNSANTDRVSESVSTIDSWQLSRRWTFDFNGNYLHTSDPLANGQDTGQPQPVGTASVISPNNAFIGPQAPFTVFGGSGTLDYQVRRHTELTFSGNYFSTREDATGLPNTTGEAFSVGYKKMVRRGQSIGLDYSAQFLSVINPNQSVTTNTFLLSYDYEWKTGKEIALFGGPQYSSFNVSSSLATSSSPLSYALNQNVLNYSAGATLSLLVTKQNSFQLMGSRRVTNGGGASGAAIQDEGQIGLSRRFNKHIFASTGEFYAEYQSIGDLPAAQPNSWGIFSHAEFNLGPSSSFSVEYDYFHQQLASSSLEPLFSHNRALVEYHYVFGSLHRQR